MARRSSVLMCMQCACGSSFASEVEGCYWMPLSCVIQCLIFLVCEAGCSASYTIPHDAAFSHLGLVPKRRDPFAFARGRGEKGNTLARHLLGNGCRIQFCHWEIPSYAPSASLVSFALGHCCRRMSKTPNQIPWCRYPVPWTRQLLAPVRTLAFASLLPP